MGHVYLLKADRRWDGRNLIKIGMTNKPDVYGRVNQVQQEWANERGIKVSYVSSFETSSATADEAELHRKWKHRSVFGGNIKKKWGGECSGDTEWFAVDNNEFRSLTGGYSHSNQSDRIPWFGIAAAAITALLILIMAQRRSDMPSDALAALNGERTCTTTQLANARNPNPTGKPIAIKGQTIAPRTTIKVAGRGEWLEIRSGQWQGKVIWGEMCR